MAFSCLEEEYMARCWWSSTVCDNMEIRMCLILNVNDFSQRVSADLPDNVAAVNTDATSMQVFFKRIIWIIPSALVMLNHQVWLSLRLVSLSLWNLDDFEVLYHSNREQMSKCVVWFSNCSWRFVWRWNSEFRFGEFTRNERNIFIYMFANGRVFPKSNRKVKPYQKKMKRVNLPWILLQWKYVILQLSFYVRIFLNSLYRR